jgi:hypothetical protein
MADPRQQVQHILDDADRPAEVGQEEGLSPTLPHERSRQFRYTNFSRMSLNWAGDDAAMLGEIEHKAEQIVQARFARAFRVIEKIKEIIVVPKMVNGEVLFGLDGERVPETDKYGDPVEDWARLNDTDRLNFLGIITTHLFDWEREATRMWMEAMFAKVMWEEKFANGFIKMPGNAISGRPTIDDRTQTGHSFSASERYFAVFQSGLSREADVVIRNLVRMQRLLENTAMK